MFDVVFIRLTLHKVAMIDAVDAAEIIPYNWHAHKSQYNYYACRKVGKRGQQKRIWMHNAIMKPDKDQEVHHKDGNSLNNRRSNLVVCTKVQNLSYRKKRCNNANSG